jgi:hypothetical protein
MKNGNWPSGVTRRRTIPLDVNSPRKGVGHNPSDRPLLYYRLLTRWETRQNVAIRPHTPNLSYLSRSLTPSSLGFRAWA